MIELDCLETIEGSAVDHDLVLFALSTCPHCRRARDFLGTNDLTYRFVYLDQLKGDEQKEVLEITDRFNPRRSFPTLVIDDEGVLVGFSETDWKARLL
ncbi:MAG: glutaredoxin family protein [Actinomycetota bacterium]